MALLYEYCAIWNPKTTKDAQGNDTTPASEIVLEPDRILAKNEQIVATLVARKIPEKWLDKIDEIQIFIHPF